MIPLPTTFTDPRRVVAMLSLEDASWLGRWRTLPGHEACEAEGHLWVRGPGGAAWAVLPALARYTEDAAGRLIPAGGRVPMRMAPVAGWQPLQDFLRVRPHAAALPAQHVAPLAWALVPAQSYHEPALLTLPFATFAEWCLNAPSVRLHPLHYAVAADGRACVRGSPLPALPGERWWLDPAAMEKAGATAVAIPAGWELPRGVTPSLITAQLKMASGEVLLLHPDASAERLPAEAFLNATRASIRATLRSRADA